MKVIRITMVLVIIAGFCTMPTLSHAQRSRTEPIKEESAQDAYNAARIDAKEDVSKFKWLGCGCIGSWVGVGVAFLVSSMPDQSKFVGKSSDYIYTYTTTYKKTARGVRTKYALLGCGVTGLLATTGCIIAMTQETCDPSCGLDDACVDPLGLNSCMESFEGSGCYETGDGCKSPSSCDDEIDCATGESCQGGGCGESSSLDCGPSSSSSSCGGSAEYLSP